ncbi:SDR family NAD(P)-dependent oxidoreductase [Actinoplanes sp. NBRC 103695]|uniref:SDR family NAD(P)-dependent oxidoreductase n=1 Tax=Actinoplanes sp. NBRC 103695 TaxID=3032202 RepID=UPI0024A49F90|nr:SDR family NAD(P)-dependent oxidoreductase [Actinoplanes sp. NBRC 103695]GLY97255.1 dehydrogenase [Actinoplanes sp. NBRC 103695]
MFHGKNVLITGASRGLGRAFAFELAARGARPIVLARSGNALRDVANEIQQRHAGTQVEVIVADLAAPDGPHQALQGLQDRGIAIDLLINNAAIGTQGAFLSRSLTSQLRSVAVNVAGLLAVTHPIAADMAARGSGGIIFITSGAAFAPMAYLASYGATKAFQLYLSEALAEELRGTGVHVMGAHVPDMQTSFGEGSTAPIAAWAEKPELIAAQTLDDYARGRAASYPGRAVNRALTWPSRLVPRTTSARLSASFARKRGLNQVTESDRPTLAG